MKLTKYNISPHDFWNATIDFIRQQAGMNPKEKPMSDASTQAAPTELPPIVEIAEAVAETIASPTPSSILSDVELAISLVKQLRALAASHPTLKQLIEALF